MRYIKLEDLQKFPIRKDHYDKENGNEHFIYGIETVLEYAENLPTEDVVPRAEVEKAKQEVARDLIDAVICFIKSDKGTIYSSIYEEMFYHNIGVESTKNALSELVEEFEKKYIGE